ncbi:MAG: hypothetical protein ACRCXH_06665 [Shewanella sp.]
MRALDFDPAFDNAIVAVHEAETMSEMPPLADGLIRAEEEKWFSGETGTTPAPEPEIGGFVRGAALDDNYGKIGLFPKPVDVIVDSGRQAAD